MQITAFRPTAYGLNMAYNSQYAQPIQTQCLRVLMGTYDVQATYLSVKEYYTNTTQGRLSR